MTRRSTLSGWLEIPVLVLARLLYRVRVIGAHNVPVSGGAVLIANHLSYVDVVVLQLACRRPLRFLAFNGSGTSALIRWVFRRASVIEVSHDRPLQWLRRSVKALAQGELVCVFPEGGISRTGQLMALRKGFEIMAKRAGVPVIPAAIDGLWGSLFSFAENRFLWKSPRLLPTPVCVAFGEPIPHDRANLMTARRALLELWTAAFDERPMLRRNFSREVVRALARRPGSIALVDRTAERRELKAAQLIAAAAVLARRLRETVPERRVGIVLPPGAGVSIANMAVAAAGKVPVNLNFTTSRSCAQSSITTSGVRTVLTADALRARLEDFPWPERTVDLRAELQAAGGKRAMLPWIAAAWLLPNQWVAWLMGFPAKGDREEAALLFTSGSGGDPKGVVLSHRNLLANCEQISSMGILPRSATILGCLPIFHSFGFTFTMWYPFLRGCLLVTTPSPLDTRAIVDSIREEGVTVLIAAPTFIRPLMKKAAPADLRSLTLVVTGAEKLPEALRQGFLEKFSLEILQGYGLTETSPVSNVNQPHPPVTTETADEQVGYRSGTVGRLLPGMSARIVHPDTGAELKDGETGILWLRGPNVFSRYLHEDGPADARLREGWFVTWDLASIDSDGFMTVEGRLARFSKIGGEMVPHGAIEQKIAEVFGIDPGELQSVAVVGVPDEAKGEAIVALTTLGLSAAEMRERLSANGFPNLWIPKTLIRVGSIPVLGSGKLDIAGCKRLAAEGSAG
jgi:acyl-[acyl-carrier-protein]-phospholipid O-acyltransferase / long-chain-fatty-acid--[acyl-carrier-protein] ligase